MVVGCVLMLWFVVNGCRCWCYVFSVVCLLLTLGLLWCVVLALVFVAVVGCCVLFVSVRCVLCVFAVVFVCCRYFMGCARCLLLVAVAVCGYWSLCAVVCCLFVVCGWLSLLSNTVAVV